LLSPAAVGCTFVGDTERGRSGRRRLGPGPTHPHHPLCRDPGVTPPLRETEFPHMPTTSKRLHTLVTTGAIATTVALVLAGCGARAGDATPGGESAAPSCVDTSGDTIKLGFLNSLTGGMAISE